MYKQFEVTMMIKKPSNGKPPYFKTFSSGTNGAHACQIANQNNPDYVASNPRAL